jgi:hypothetical protein
LGGLDGDSDLVPQVVAYNHSVAIFVLIC